MELENGIFTMKVSNKASLKNIWKRKKAVSEASLWIKG
jgi:hypothetical protein